MQTQVSNNPAVISTSTSTEPSVCIQCGKVPEPAPDVCSQCAGPIYRLSIADERDTFEYAVIAQRNRRVGAVYVGFGVLTLCLWSFAIGVYALPLMAMAPIVVAVRGRLAGEAFLPKSPKLSLWD